MDTEDSCSFILQSTAECTTYLNPGLYAGFNVCSNKNCSTTTVVTESGGATVANITDCTGTLTDIQLTFTYSDLDGAGFIIQGVTMTYSANTNTIAVGDRVDLVVKSTFVEASATSKSGNIGYLSGKPLLLATTSGALAGGYRKDIADSTGACYLTANLPTGVTNQYLKFNEEINLQ